jgi:hypothetical protein
MRGCVPNTLVRLSPRGFLGHPDIAQEMPVEPGEGAELAAGFAIIRKPSGESCDTDFSAGLGGKGECGPGEHGDDTSRIVDIDKVSIVHDDLY